MNKLKYILFLLIICLVPNVFAQSINSDSYSQKDSFNTASRYDYSTNQYLGDDTNFSIGTIGTRYNGKSYYFQFNFHKSLTANKIYELKVSSTTSDFTSYINKDYITPLCYSSFAYNFNTKECGDISIISVIRGSGNQSKDFTIRFSPLQAMTYWGFKLQSGFNNLTGVSNFLINSFDLTEVNANDTDELINNQNQNAQDIIDNQNQNAQDIIDNQNQLFGSECSNLLGFPYTATNPYSITATSNDYNINTGRTIYLTSGITYKYSYGSNKDYSSNVTSGVEFFLLKDGQTSTIIHPSGKSGTFTPSVSGTYALRLDCNKSGDTCTFYNFMISTKTSTYCQYGTQSSKLDETNNSISNVNDNITNSNIDNGTGSDFFNNFSSNDHGLSSIITIPLTTIQSLTSQSCVALQIPIPFTNSNVTLPCMTQVYENTIPTIYNLWKIVSFGIIAYFIAIDIFHLVKGFKDPDSDKVEVLDL